jgi:Flp pilus assembly protein TadD
VARREAFAALLALGLLAPGCAWWSSDQPQLKAFDPSIQEAQMRRKAAAEAAPDAPDSHSVKEYLRKGDALHAQGVDAAAMWNYLQAHELDPNDPEPVARVGSLHLMVDATRAESIFRELMETHPDSGAAATGLALVHMEQHDWQAAREELVRALALRPDSAVAYSALGACLDRLEQHEEAQAAYTRATELHPSFYEALNNLGVSYITSGKFEAAVEVLRKAARHETRDPAVFNNLGLALGRMRRYDDSLDAFRRGGSEQAARNNLGYVAYLNGDYERARAEYEKALLASGDQRLLVLRNFRVAMSAEKQREASAESQPR